MIHSEDYENYELKGKIGEGSFGTVYKVLDKETGESYAAKVSVYNIDKNLIQLSILR